MEDANGNRFPVISISEPNGYLRPGVRNALRPGEIAAKGTGHVEEDIVNWAAANNMKVVTIGAGRPICRSCAGHINGAGQIMLHLLNNYERHIMDSLEFIAPKLLELLNSQNSDSLRRISLEVCRFAIANTNPDNDVLRRYLIELQNPQSGCDLSELSRETEKLDDSYFDEKDKPDEGGKNLPAMNSAFYKARAANALLAAFDPDPRKAASESIYEAFHAFRSGEDIIKFVESIL